MCPRPLRPWPIFHCRTIFHFRTGTPSRRPPRYCARWCRRRRNTCGRRWPQAFGANVWIKHENHTPIGAFKARSAAIYFHKLMQREPATPRRDHRDPRQPRPGRGPRRRRFKLPATIYVPHGNSAEKNNAMRALGVKLVEHGSEFQEAREEAARVGGRDGLHMVPAFHADIVLGVATYWAELFRAVPDIDVVYVPIGQGSGICAAAAARNVYSPRRRSSAWCPRRLLFRAVVRSTPGGRGAGEHVARRRHGLPQARRGGGGDRACEREPRRRGRPTPNSPTRCGGSSR